MTKESQVKIAAWSLFTIVCLLAIFAWGSGYDWHIWPLNAYVIFPVLGLLAFSTMWVHYIMGTVRELSGADENSLKPFYHYTGWLVLILICFHPGLLIYQLYIDGAGLPPFSYERYVSPGLGWITLLGTASLLVFLAFELHRVFGKKSWWHYVVDASDFAMLAIVYHSLRLGTDLRTESWYRAIWWVYAITLTAVLIRKYTIRIQSRTKTKPAG